MVTQKKLSNKHNIWALALSLALVILLCLTVQSLAGDTEAAEDNLFDMSLEDLMEVPVVVSGSRQEQKLNESSVPISIVTADDIHYSGVTNIPEILRFVPGVDVIKMDRNRYAVSVRGMHDVYSDKTLVLIDGRSAYSPVFGGAEWHRLPILMEDIARIEVVRGPGGAAWGANAFNGVINIIMKKPADTLGHFATTTISEFGDSYTQYRWGAQTENLSWRCSLGYQEHASSDEAGSGEFETLQPALNAFTGFPSYKARDFGRNIITDNSFVYQYSDDITISFGIAHSNLETGAVPMGGFYPSGNSRFETTRVFTKIDKEFDDGSTGYLQWFGNFESTNLNDNLKYRSSENDIELQYNFDWGENHKTSIGANVRMVRIVNRLHHPQALWFESAPFNEQFVGAFLIDRWQITDKLTIESQFRGDYYSETQTDWAGRVTALYALDADKNHILRFSGARAFRTPMASLRTVRTARVGPGLIRITSQKDMKNEGIFSLEAGYTGRFDRGLTVRLDGYWQKYNNLVGLRNIAGPGAINIQNYSGEDAEAWGAELEIGLENKSGKIAAWYAYNDFATEKYSQSVRTYTPSQHKYGITARKYLPDDFTFNVNFNFNERTYLSTNTSIKGKATEDTYHLDMTLSKKIFNGNGEIMIGVSDLLSKYHKAAHTYNTLAAHKTPGRMFFMRMELKF